MRYVTAHRTARERAAQACMTAPDGYEVLIQAPRRNSEQNAKLHAAISDIARCLRWHGRQMSVEDWKRLLTAAWMRAENQQVAMVPALDGNGFDVLYRRTSQMSKDEVSSLIEYVLAWGTEHGVRWRDE